MIPITYHLNSSIPYPPVVGEGRDRCFVPNLQHHILCPRLCEDSSLLLALTSVSEADYHMAESETIPMETKEESTSADQQYYYLRAYPHPENKNPAASRISGHYVRLHGSGTDVVLLTPASPIYLRGHFEPATDAASDDSASIAPTVGRQVFTSPAERHQGLFWGLTLTIDSRDTKALSGWERVEIIKGSKPSGWAFEEVELTLPDQSDSAEGAPAQVRVAEQLVWRGDSISLPSADESGDDSKYAWKGWMVSEWSYAGNKPQVFWLTDKLKAEELPPNCERIVLIREWL